MPTDPTDPVTLDLRMAYDSATKDLFRAFDVVMKRHEIRPRQMGKLVQSMFVDVGKQYEEYVYENGDI